MPNSTPLPQVVVNITNQLPAELYAEPYNQIPNIPAIAPQDVYYDALFSDYEERHITPLFQPIQAGSPVQINVVDMDGNQGDVEPSTLKNATADLWLGGTTKPELVATQNEILRQSMRYHTPNDWFPHEQLMVEALTRSRLPLPEVGNGRMVKYSAKLDVIPSAKHLLAQNDDQRATEWFASMAGFLQPMNIDNALIISVMNEDVLKDISNEMANFQSSLPQNTLTAEVRQSISNFGQLSFDKDTVMGIFLPTDANDPSPRNKVQDEALSFGRILQTALAAVETNGSNQLMVLPTNVKEVYLPTNVIFVNVEETAHSTERKVQSDWENIVKVFQQKKQFKFMSNNKLRKAKPQSSSDKAGGLNSSFDASSTISRRVDGFKFSSKPVTAKKSITMMKKIVDGLTSRMATQNTYKNVKSSFMRPNRRDPDNMNLAGKISQVQYRPDIHIYLDTSGSISERNFKDAITSLIVLAKSMNVNLYYTTFSHYISGTTLLKTKDRTVSEIYRELMNTPRVGGGTDFEPVWRKINIIQQLTNASPQVNFVITDFGYTLSHGYRFSPNDASYHSTFYVPVSVSEYEWQHVVSYAREFSAGMIQAGVKDIRKRILA